MFNEAKICTSIIPKNSSEISNSIEKAFSFGTKYIEIRFDYLETTKISDMLPILKKYSDRCIYTCRKFDEGGSFNGDENLRIDILKKLSKQNPAFIDVELSTITEKPDLSNKLKSNGSSLIVSWHNFSETPSENILKTILMNAKSKGDISKIVTFAKKFQDNIKILSLYKSESKNKIIAFCMGNVGIISRVLCVSMGSPLTYASLEDNPTAKGQISVLELKNFYDAF